MSNANNFFNSSMALFFALFFIHFSAGAADSNSSGSSAEQEESQGSILEEIIVTALRREQSIQDVPMSITALSGAELELKGAQDFLDFARTIPGLNVNETNRGAVDIGIRGIRTLTAGVGGATVGYYIDEISVSAPNGTPLLATFDLDRVEILSGPQGTLFGEGSLGGTIRFISNKPDSNKFSAKVKASYADIEHGERDADVAAMVNVPLIKDTLALRAVGHYQDNGGFIDNVAPGDEEQGINDSRIRGGRAILRWTPTDQLTITPSFTYQKSSFRASAAETLIPDVGNPGAFVSIGELQQSLPGLSPGMGNDKFIQPSIVVEYKFDRFDFTSASNYFDSDLDAVGGFVMRDNEIFTQEVRLVSTGDGPWQWVLGGFYKDQNAGATIDFTVPNALSLFIDTQTELKQYAAFGTLSYTFFDKLTVDVGGRLFREEVDETNVTQQSLIIAPPPVPPLVLIDSLAEGGGNNTEFVPRVNVSYDFTNDLMVYGSVAKGFRRGQVNTIDSSLGFVPAGVPRFTEPDTLWSYEFGLKSILRGGDAHFNAAFFYIDWDDIQISDAAILPGPTIVEFLRNAGKANSKGVEFSAAWQVNDNLNLSLNGTVARAELGEDVPGLVGGGLDGDELPTSPSYSFTGSAEYSRPVFTNTTGMLRVDVSAVDGQFSALGSPASLTKSDSYVLANLRGGLDWDRFRLHLFVNNLFDKRAEYSYDAVNDFEIIRNQPRTIGLELTANF